MRNYTLVRVWGIPIQINVSLLVFLPILAWLIGSGGQIEVYAGFIEAIAPGQLDVGGLGPQSRWTIGILAGIGLFVSVALHELGHAWAAMRYDIEVQSITLWILGGLASLSDVPKEWDREFWIALAGPAVSLAVAVVCIGATGAVPRSLPVAVFVVGWLGVTNLLLTVFNLLPAFPMDGGRVLRALLARSGARSHASATRIAAGVGKGFAILFAVFGVLALSPLFLLLALFVYGAAAGESRMVVLGELLGGLTVGDLTTDAETVGRNATVGDTVRRLMRERRTSIAVTDRGRVVGAVTATGLREVDPDDYETTVDAFVETDLPRVDAETDAFEALTTLSEDRGRGEVVVERDGEPVGIVSLEDFTAFIDLRSA
jgi:Zn-dependent protease/CBS domain-containing protein